MTSSKLGTKMGLLATTILLFAATSSAQQRTPIAEQIAKAYGLDSFGQIDAIRYTFNIPARKVSQDVDLGAES